MHLKLNAGNLWIQYFKIFSQIYLHTKVDAREKYAFNTFGMINGLSYVCWAKIIIMKIKFSWFCCNTNYKNNKTFSNP